MRAAVRQSVAALACLSVIAGSSASAQDGARDAPNPVAVMSDSSRLPRIAGSQQLFASEAMTMLVVRQPVAQAADATRALLAAQGWQQYVDPFSSSPQQPDHATLSFKNGPQLLVVSIGVAPAQGGATTIQYVPRTSENDLPFPNDATDIGFAPDRPQLECVTADTVGNTLAFFARELAARGYAERSAASATSRPPGERAGETAADGSAYFVRGDKTLQLALRRTDDGKVKVELKAVPRDAIAAQAQPAEPAPQAKPAEMVDVRTLPRPAGAYVKDEDARKASATSFTFMVPANVADTKAAVSRLLAADSWVPFTEPLEPPHQRNLSFKKDGQSISLFFMTDGADTTRSGVSVTPERLYNAIPFPPGAREVVFDHRRPYLDTVASGTIEDLLAFFRKELAASGWQPWNTADAARWPDARIEPVIEDGVRAYFTRGPYDRQPPIQLSLQHRPDGRTDVEVKVPPFARPQDLAAGPDDFGLPKPERSRSASARDGEVRRELTATVPAELATVLAFYRRELAKRNWKEEPRGAVVTADEAVLNFSTADSTAVLKLGYQFDLTTVSLVQALPDTVVQARAKARKDAEDKLRKQAEDWMHAPAAALSAMTTPTNSPIAVPETAENPDFDRGRGDLKFNTTSGVKEIAAFYRAAMKPLGFKELPTAIDDDRMAALDFVRGGKRLSISILQVGSRTNVRSYGPGLLALADQPAPQTAKSGAPAPLEDLEADDTDGLPVPKKHTLSSGGKSPFRTDREATVTASLESTLAFYRRELGKLGWKEQSKGAVVTPQRVALSFAAPTGPGTLKLARDNANTTVDLSQRAPDQAAKLGVVALPGKGRIMLGSVLTSEAVVTISRQTIKLAPGAGKTGGGPKLDLAPGKYRMSVTIAGKPAFDQEVTVVVGETTGLLIGPSGGLPLQVY
jgi:hypothetical protein